MNLFVVGGFVAKKRFFALQSDKNILVKSLDMYL